MHEAISAEEIMGAALEGGLHGDLMEMFLSEFEATEWMRHEDKAYPPCYAYGRGRYRAHPDAVARLREEIASIPRVDVDLYDILLNIEGTDPMFPGPTWDVVKWMRMPEFQGFMPGHGFVAVVLLEPFPVYTIPGWRDPLSLSDYDFNQLRENAVTLRDGGKGISRELLKNNLRRQAENRQRRSEEDLDFAEYYRTRFRRMSEELGI